MVKIKKLYELVDPTTRDDLGEPTKGLIGLVDLKFMCPQCGYEVIGKEDTEVICPTCKIPMVVKREENMDYKETISSKVKRLRELVESIDPVEEKKVKKSEQDEEPKKDDDEKEKEKEDEKEKEVKEAKKSKKSKKSEQDEEPKKDDDEEEDDDEEDDKEKKDDEEEPKAEKKSKKNEEVEDGELVELPAEEPEKEEEPKEEQEEEPKGEIDLTALLDFLNQKTGVAFEITNAVFNQSSGKLTIALSPDLPPEVADMKDEIASIFDAEPGDVTVTQTSVEVEGVEIMMPEEDDKEGFPGVKIKDMDGVKVHFVKAEGDEEDRLACPAGYKAEDGKCVPVEAPMEGKMSIKESFRTLRKLL